MKTKGLIALAAVVAILTVVGPVVGSLLYTDRRRTDAMATAHGERQEQTAMLRAICTATHAACLP